LEIEVFNLCSMLKDAIDLGKSGHSDIIVDGVYEKDIMNICADKNLVRDAFLNIVRNSVDAMEEGGNLEVKVDYYTSDGDNALDKGKYVRVSIKDNGEGIASEDLERIFETFYSSKGSKGTGLGLAIAYKTITQLDGDIKYKSELGVGTEALVHLPAVKD